MKKTVRIVITIICTICFLSLISCDRDPYKGQRPIEYPNSVWTCEEYNITFSVSSDCTLESASLVIRDTETPFKFTWAAFNNSVGITFNYQEEKVVLLGRCKFGSEAFSIYIADTKGYYPTEEVTLEFERMK